MGTAEELLSTCITHLDAWVQKSRSHAVFIPGKLRSELGQNEPYHYEICHIQMMNSGTLTEIKIIHGHSVLQYVYSVEVCH